MVRMISIIKKSTSMLENGIGNSTIDNSCAIKKKRVFANGVSCILSHTRQANQNKQHRKRHRHRNKLAYRSLAFYYISLIKKGFKWIHTGEEVSFTCIFCTFHDVFLFADGDYLRSENNASTCELFGV